MSESFDAIVMGSGKAGKTLAVAFAQAGKKTAMIERQHIAGSCINVACIPTKTMVASARVAQVCRDAARFGVDTGPVRVDMARVRQRKRDVVTFMRGANLKRFESTPGLDFMMGQARFRDAHTVDVDLNDGGSRTLTAPLIFINTGCRPGAPRIPGLADVPTLDSTAIQELDVTPEHLLILGGGYVGLEFGQMFRRFGSKVSVVELSPRLFPREDEDISAEILKVMREEGVDILLGAKVLGVAKAAEGKIRLQVSGADGERELIGSHLLVAIGRIPNTETLNLAGAGVTTDARGFIPVNERLETNVKGIYALGDVNGGYQFTHIALDDFRVIRSNLLQNDGRTTAHRLLPYAVFIDPELGRVGITEQEARERKLVIKVFKVPMAAIARARTKGELHGFMKAIVDANTDQILGAAILGSEGGEVMAALQMAMIGKVPYTVVRDSILAHPTLVEGLNDLFQSPVQ